jgi:hypothetical protein
MFWAAFAYGLVAGFLLVRLRRHRRRQEREPTLLIHAGWLVLALSFTLAAALLLYGLWRELG